MGSLCVISLRRNIRDLLASTTATLHKKGNFALLQASSLNKRSSLSFVSLQVFIRAVVSILYLIYVSNVGQFSWSWKTISKFRRRKIKSFARVHVVHKTRCGLAATAKKSTKFVMHLQTCCSVNLKLLLFCRSCCRRRSRCWSSFKSKAVKPQAFFFLHLLNQVCLLGV